MRNRIVIWLDSNKGLLAFTKANIKTGLPGDAPYPVVTVGRVPPVIGQPLLASVTPDASRQESDPPLPCAMGVFLKTGVDEYSGYGLLGGP